MFETIPNRRAAAIALAATIIACLAGCEKPRKGAALKAPPNPPGETEKTVAPPDPPQASAGGPETPEPAPAKIPEPIPEEKPPNSVAPILDVRKTADRILITGHLQSEFQTRDIITILSDRFPEHKVVSELDVGPHVKTAGGWANRVCDLLVPLFEECKEGGHFRFEKGVTTIEGKVSSNQVKASLYRHTGYVMEDFDARGIENKLDVAP